MERLSFVQWTGMRERSFDDISAVSSRSMRRSSLTKQRDMIFSKLRRQWRQRKSFCDAEEELQLRNAMLTAKTCATKSWRKDHRRRQRGTWLQILALRQAHRVRQQWDVLRGHRVEATGRGTLTMIEEGVREVAQLGFKHNVVESELWMEEMALDELVGGDIDPDILEDRTLWAGKRGGAILITASFRHWCGNSFG